MTHLVKLRSKTFSASSKTVIMAVALYLFSIILLDFSDSSIIAIATEFTKPDLAFSYAYTDIILSLTLLGEAGRSAYGFNLVIDSIMPVLFALATVLVAAKTTSRWWGVLSIAPITFMILDIIENIAFGFMLFQFPDVSPGLVAYASPVTMVKLASFVLALPTLIIGGVYLFIRRIGSKIGAR